MVLLTLSAGTETDRLKSGAAVVMLRRELFFFFPMLERDGLNVKDVFGRLLMEKREVYFEERKGEMLGFGREKEKERLVLKREREREIICRTRR